MKEKLKLYCKSLNIEYIGIASIGPYKELEEILRDRQRKGYITGFEEPDIQIRIDPKRTMCDVESIIVCLFPYFTGYPRESNLSKYAHSIDYHLLIQRKLNQIGEYLKGQIEGFHFQSYVDTGPLVDRYLAYLAGLGYFGLNNHIITDQYGSYVLIGYLLNNYPFEPDVPMDRVCDCCGLCIEKCPGSALLGNFEMDPNKCCSFITQKKEALNHQEIDILRRTKTIFGCDICQDVCPHNQNIQHTNLEEFKKDLIFTVHKKEIEEMSNKDFKRKYGDRAFSWRGKKVILRNLDSTEGKP